MESENDTLEYSLEPAPKKLKLSAVDSDATDSDSQTSGHSSSLISTNINGTSHTHSRGIDIHLGSHEFTSVTCGSNDTERCEEDSVGSGGFEVCHSRCARSEGSTCSDGQISTADNDSQSMNSGGFEVTNVENSRESNGDFGVTNIDGESNCQVADGTAGEKTFLLRGDSQTAGPSSACSKTSIKKIASIVQDAESISAVLGLDDVDEAIYHRLRHFRDRGNRTDLVINEVLEGGIESLREKFDETEEESDIGIFEEIDSIKSAIFEKLPTAQVNPDEIFTLLENCGDSSHRITEVVEQFLRKYTNSGKTVRDNGPENERSLPGNDSGTQKIDQCESSDIMKDVQEVLKTLPQADPYEVYCLLESQGAEKKVQNVINTLKSKTVPINGEHYDLSNTELYQDMKVVSNMFPEKDKNEIYAYLEAHYRHPNRIEIVAEELLRMQNGNQGTAAVSRATGDGHVSTTDTRGSMFSLRHDVEMMQKVFPDCDPNYLFEQLESMSADSDRVNHLSATMFDRRNYPKLKDRVDVEKKKQRLRQLQNMELNIEEFLQMFPDPEQVFYDDQGTITESYKEHALIQLQNELSMLGIPYIQKKFEAHSGHYLPTLMELRKLAEMYDRDPNSAAREHKRFLATPRPGTKKMPDTPDELFYKELLFARNEDAILDHMAAQKDAKVRKLEEARKKGELYECTCCYDDEVLFDDMLACPEGHLFCRQCVKGQADENIGQAKVTFPCLDGDCDKDFSLTTLQAVLSSKSFSILLRRIQEEEIRQAGIEDLIGCPFCSFATIITDVSDKVFKCLNPECLKESCRLCKEPNHIPLRCDEVEKDSEKDMRAYIERKMTEAMIRTCGACKKRFFKIEGCNKMTCTCGASMCYVCREPITGYEHFNNGNCSNVEDAGTLHTNEMQKAAQDARMEYLRDHPEADGTQLKYDPVKLISGPNGASLEYEDDSDDDY